jgi:alkylhydroperoxidase/carboxymuconolactone decarboxylase family protein YurZ
MPKLPKRFTDFTEQDPTIARAYAALGEAVHAAGPLGTRERALVKLGIAIGTWREGAVHAQARKGLEAGLSAEDLRHVALLALPTIGFPSTMAALSWVEDIAPARGAVKKAVAALKRNGRRGR